MNVFEDMIGQQLDAMYDEEMEIRERERDSYNQALEDCCNVLRQCWLNGTVANRIIKEQITEIEKLKR